MRTANCTRADGRNRLAQAKAFVEVAELIDVDDESLPLGAVIGSLSVLAGIAASDAVCCAALHKYPRGQAHIEAVALIRTISPDGPNLAKLLNRLVARKNDANYGLTFLNQSDAERLLSDAREMIRIVENHPAWTM